jgi:predicted P-loop ATPase
MKIVLNDDREFQGTPLQIVHAMQNIAFGGDGLTARRYIESVVDDAQRFEGIALRVTGNTDSDLAASLINEMVRTGLARRVWTRYKTDVAMVANPDNADALARQMAEFDEGERIRRWRRGMQAGEERQRSLRAAEGPRPAQAVAECISALNALEAMGMWPAPLDPISEQNVQEVRDRWARIQRRARAQALLEKAVAGAVARFHVDLRRLARAALREELRRICNAMAPSREPSRRRVLR